MRTIERSSAFKKDFKREVKGKHSKIISDLLKSILIELVADKPLKLKYRDHDLTGNWNGYRECHLKPDLLLIYQKKDEDILRLARLGSHSELFG